MFKWSDVKQSGNCYNFLYVDKFYGMYTRDWPDWFLEVYTTNPSDSEGYVRVRVNYHTTIGKMAMDLHIKPDVLLVSGGAAWPAVSLSGDMVIVQTTSNELHVLHRDLWKDLIHTITPVSGQGVSVGNTSFSVKETLKWNAWQLTTTTREHYSELPEWMHQALSDDIDCIGCIRPYPFDTTTGLLQVNTTAGWKVVDWCDWIVYNITTGEISVCDHHFYSTILNGN